MNTLDVVRDSLGRVHELIPAVLDGLTGDDLLWRADPEANPIGWLIWHLTRIEDDHLAQLSGVEQAWTADGWYQRFGLPYLKHAHGFRMTPVEVGAFNVTCSPAPRRQPGGRPRPCSHRSPRTGSTR